MCNAMATMLIWATRDVIRRPMEAVLTAVALWGLITVVATVLLLTRSLAVTAEKILQQAPSLVIRRINAGGWTPLPVAAAVAAASKVPGVTGVRPRIWGTVRGPDGPITVVGTDGKAARAITDGDAIQVPATGEAVTGQGVSGSRTDGTLVLLGQTRQTFRVIAQLPPAADVVVGHVVLLHPRDTRQLLGLPAGFASDLAVEVFHDGEAAAMASDLAEAFPWPVRITTRRETCRRYTGGFARRGGIALIAVMPGLLALALLVVTVARDRVARRYEMGLLKAIGWTTGDIFRLQMFRAAVVALPAGAMGAVSAWALVFWPGTVWPGLLLFGWRSRPPALYMDAAHAGLLLLEIVALVIVPFLVAHLWPTLKGAATAPRDMMEGEWTI